MSINSKLKKNGIEIVEMLDTLKVNTIAINVADKLCLAYPEHNLDKRELFELISRLNMYTAKMPNDSSGAKFVFKNNSIYFNEKLSIDEMSELAVHECIHCFQYSYSESNSTPFLGLCNKSSNFGLSLNEAAVQLMASEANFSNPTQETYYGVSIKTISPDYYPLECTLAKQITYFTGTYPLYHSALYCDDIFKNMFSIKTNKKAYEKVVKNFDNLLNLENNLNYFLSELQYADKTKEIRLLNNLINKNRKEILDVFFDTQNLIIESFFKNEFNSIRNLEDITLFNKKIYNFKNLIGYCDNYTFYNDFYIKMMDLVQAKKEYIEKYGEINLYENLSKSLMIVDKSKNLLYFINKFVYKLKKLVKLNKNTNDEFNM